MLLTTSCFLYSAPQCGAGPSVPARISQTNAMRTLYGIFAEKTRLVVAEISLDSFSSINISLPSNYELCRPPSRPALNAWL